MALSLPQIHRPVGLKSIYKILGLIAVGLGMLGAFLPLLPTTPFLLLALWLFARSSPRLRRWLLTNRIFGPYLNDYRSGRGVSLRIKVFVLSLLWVTILGSVFFAADSWWVRILLLCIAVGVTIHLLYIPTKRPTRRIAVLVPTEHEAAPFRRKLGLFRRQALTLEVTGMGVVATKAAVERIVAAQKPDLLILAGIAGAYPGSGLSLGDCVLVGSERTADPAACGGATGLTRDHVFECPYTIGEGAFRIVSGTTVAACAVPLREGTLDGEKIENMEGAAFFAAATAAGTPFLELRSVSNEVGADRSEWDIPLAASTLAQALTVLLSGAFAATEWPAPRRKNKRWFYLCADFFVLF